MGAGSWGTALALLLARNGHSVLLWGHDPDEMQELRRNRSNQRYLPGMHFPENLAITDDLSLATKASNLLLIVVPSHAFRHILELLRPLRTAETCIAWATKGLELQTGHPLHQVVADVLGEKTPAAVLSGPTFAGEVAAGQPTAITVASESSDLAGQLVAMLHNPCRWLGLWRQCTRGVDNARSCRNDEARHRLGRAPGYLDGAFRGRRLDPHLYR